MTDVKKRAQELNSRITEWRRYLHQHPEIGLDTPGTEAFIVERLKEMGADDIRSGVGGHGVVALIKGQKPGKVLGIRADMDALDMKEKPGKPYASTNNYMHACGHDAHVAMLLGAAQILVENRENLKGTVKLIFQPGEEGSMGAQAMIDDGALENPPLDGIIGLHTGNLWKGLTPGMVGYRFGALMASSDWFTVTFEGKGGHGATPHLTVDPIVMASQAISALQLIASREVSPFDSAVVTVGKIEGGTAPNIIAPTCTIRGTFRSLDPETRKMLARRISEICENIARGLRGRADMSIDYGTPPLVNDHEMTEKLKKAAAEVLGEDNVAEVPEPTMGGEDMALFLERVPGTFFFHPSAFGEGKDFPHHHPEFDIDESVLWVGTAVMAHFALTWQPQGSDL